MRLMRLHFIHTLLRSCFRVSPFVWRCDVTRRTGENFAERSDAGINLSHFPWEIPRSGYNDDDDANV